MHVCMCVCARQTFICYFADVDVIVASSSDGAGDDSGTLNRLPSAYAAELVQGRSQSEQRHAKICQS